MKLRGMSFHQSPYENDGSPWKTAFIALIFAFGLVALVRICASYPYYQSWDMDLITVIDGFLINSGQIPVHFAHPAAGMYAILHPIHWFAELFGWVAVFDLNDLQQAVNPLAAVAEVTNLYRGLSAFFIALSALFLWMAICRVFRPSMRLGALALLVLLFQPYGIAASTLVRTELSAFFYWSIAIYLCAGYATSAAVESDMAARRRFLRLAGIGFFLGMVMITKVQGVFLILCALPIAIILGEYSGVSNQYLLSSVSRRWSAMPLLIFLGFSLPALFTRATDVAHFRQGFGLSPLWLAMFVGLLFLARPGLLQKVSRRFYFSGMADSAYLMVPVATGFLLAPFSGALLGYSWQKGIEFILLSFKITFMGTIAPNIAQQAGFSLARGWQNIERLWWVWLLLAGASVFQFLWFRSGRLTRRGLNAWFGALALLLLINFIAVRDAAARDMIWLEPTMLFLLLVFLLSGISASRGMYHQATSGGLFANSIIYLIFSLILFGEYQNWSETRSLATGYYSEESFFSDIYGGVQELYTDVMAPEYVERWPTKDEAQRYKTSAAWAARNYQADRDLLRNIFLNSQPETSYVGRLTRHFRVWHGRSEERISDVDANLEGSILVDVAGLWRKKTENHESWLTRFLKSLMIHDPIKREVLNKDQLVFRERNDARLLLFLEEQYAANTASALGLLPAAVEPTVVRNGDQPPRSFVAYSVPDAIATLEVAKISGDYFMTVTRLVR